MEMSASSKRGALFGLWSWRWGLLAFVVLVVSITPIVRVVQDPPATAELTLSSLDESVVAADLDEFGASFVAPSGTTEASSGRVVERRYEIDVVEPHRAADDTGQLLVVDVDTRELILFLDVAAPVEVSMSGETAVLNPGGGPVSLGLADQPSVVRNVMSAMWISGLILLVVYAVTRRRKSYRTNDDVQSHMIEVMDS